MKKRFLAPFIALILIFALSAAALADTIRLKDGSVIRGQIIGFRDQQFIVLVGSGSRGRRSQITIYMEDVESIEFDSAANAPAINDNNTAQTSRPITPTTTTTTRPPIRQQPDISQNTRPEPDNTISQPINQPASSTTSLNSFKFPVRVRGDNAANGWTNSGLVVQRGQILRITATGRVNLGGGRVSTPVGIPDLLDPKKLMPNVPTGGLIAVIGDDNDDFIFIGSKKEFVAQRDGVLFLGVNEDDLTDNMGAYDTVIEAEVMRAGSR